MIVQGTVSREFTTLTIFVIFYNYLRDWYLHLESLMLTFYTEGVRIFLSESKSLHPLEPRDALTPVVPVVLSQFVEDNGFVGVGGPEVT